MTTPSNLLFLFLVISSHRLVKVDCFLYSIVKLEIGTFIISALLCIWELYHLSFSPAVLSLRILLVTYSRPANIYFIYLAFYSAKIKQACSCSSFRNLQSFAGNFLLVLILYFIICLYLNLRLTPFTKSPARTSHTIF